MVHKHLSIRSAERDEAEMIPPHSNAATEYGHLIDPDAFPNCVLETKLKNNSLLK